MDLGQLTLADLADLGTSVILIVITWQLWRRLNKVTDDTIAILKELREPKVVAMQLPDPPIAIKAESDEVKPP